MVGLETAISPQNAGENRSLEWRARLVVGGTNRGNAELISRKALELTRDDHGSFRVGDQLNNLGVA